VDIHAAVRILRGHDDLLQAFQNRFAPKSDLRAVKAELDGSEPNVPAAAKPANRVKQEAGVPAANKPRPPTQLPPVKREAHIVKNGVKPRPPAFAPTAPRAAVSVNDQGPEEHVEVEFRGGERASILTAVKKGRDECVTQLAKLVFSRGSGQSSGHEIERQKLAVVNYATERAAVPRFPRELFILRGAPGTGKSDYAMQRLVEAVDLDPTVTPAARLAHICAADDFFEQFGEHGERIYKYEARSLETCHAKNETRVGLAMEAGLHPLFVDCANIRLWEMQPYVALAERMGYVVTVVEPWEISDRWEDANFLQLCSNPTDKRMKVNRAWTRK